jgi:hypothetical protein
VVKAGQNRNITVTLRAKSGAALPNQILTFFVETYKAGTAQTDKAGQVRFTLPQGGFTLTAVYDGQPGKWAGCRASAKV